MKSLGGDLVHICTGYSGNIRVYEKQPIFWLGEIELRAPAVGAKIGVFLYVTLGLPERGDIVQTSIV